MLLPFGAVHFKRQNHGQLGGDERTLGNRFCYLVEFHHRAQRVTVRYYGLVPWASAAVPTVDFNVPVALHELATICIGR
eukprot:5615006-Prymnesium_polylepis.3